MLLSIEIIADLLNIKLVYWTHSSTIAYYNNQHKVFIDDSLNDAQQWQEFGHEMYHYFYDETRYDLLKET